MVSANCLRKNTFIEKCIRNSIKKDEDIICKYRFDFETVKDANYYIIDRKGKKLYYKTYCKFCYNKIFNTEPIYMLDKLDELFYQASQSPIVFENRQYKSIEDFAEKMLISKEETPAIIKKSQMIQLIKAGCFTELHHEDRKKTMIWYLKNFVFK